MLLLLPRSIWDAADPATAKAKADWSEWYKATFGESAEVDIAAAPYADLLAYLQPDAIAEELAGFCVAKFMDLWSLAWRGVTWTQLSVKLLGAAAEEILKEELKINHHNAIKKSQQFVQAFVDINEPGATLVDRDDKPHFKQRAAEALVKRVDSSTSKFMRAGDLIQAPLEHWPSMRTMAAPSLMVALPRLSLMGANPSTATSAPPTGSSWTLAGATGVPLRRH